jgi:hypothetical protein
MSSPQWRLEAVTNTTAYLIAQLRELEGLRERIRKAELARRSRWVVRRKSTRIRLLEPRSRLSRREARLGDLYAAAMKITH